MGRRGYIQPHDARYWNRLRAEIRRDPHLDIHTWSDDEIAYMKAGVEELRQGIRVTEAIWYRWKESALKIYDSGES